MSEKLPFHFLTVILLLPALSLLSCRTDIPEPASVEIDRSLPAFPEAEGHGAFSRGGRGGRALYVTNLENDGPGSFREAVESSGARTVVFAVSGVIELDRPVVVSAPFLTIAGQTAPGSGVTLKNSGLYIRTHDVTIRYIRIRPGDSREGRSFHDRDSITVGEDSFSIMIDHVSASWATDELISTWYAPQYVTVQWSILSEALHHAGHPEGGHSKALLIGDNSRYISVHHNLFAHNDDRAPALVKGGARADIINNVIYNWGSTGFSFNLDYIKTPVRVNFIGNHIIPGDSTSGDFLWFNTRRSQGSAIYAAANIGEGLYNSNVFFPYGQETFFTSRPMDWDLNLVPGSPETVLEDILASAGARLPRRDRIDSRIVSEVRSGGGMIINSPSEVGGYPSDEKIILSEHELDLIDSDRDGMADAWETVAGLDPADGNDGREDRDGDGYSNLEEYLNS